MDIPKLKSYFDLFPEDVYCWIGGGAVRSLFDKSRLKDIDVFVANRTDQERIVNHLISNGADHLQKMDMLDKLLIGDTIRIDVFCEDVLRDVTPKDSVIWSDYTIAACAIDCYGTMYYHPDFIKDCLEKRLQYIGNDITTSQAYSRPNRLRRFVNIGYDIDKENMLNLLDRMCMDKAPLLKGRWEPTINQFNVVKKLC